MLRINEFSTLSNKQIQLSAQQIARKGLQVDLIRRNHRPNIMLVRCLLSLVAMAIGTSLSSALDLMENFPTAHTTNNRIMGFILSYAYDHIDPVTLILNEYVSMCEGGWDPTVVLFTTANWSPAMHRYIRQKTFCYRTGQSIHVRLDVHDRSVGTELAAKHKAILQKELDNFDFFVYHEDDMIFKYSHLVAYLTETKKLHELNPTSGLHDNVIGFQRYRRILRGNIQGGYGENDIFEQDLFEEMPEFTPICVKDSPYLLVTGNTHQAIWAFTTAQLHMLQEKCHFLEHTSASREFMSSFLVFDHKANYCGMNKLIPGARLTTFTIWHYYQQRHVSWTPVFVGDENLRAGNHYYSNPKVKLNTPACWQSIVDQAQAEQYPPTMAPTMAATTEATNISYDKT